jgi:uncharacterized protein
VEVTVPEATPEQLELLLALQDTDSRIRRLEHQRDDLPEQRQLDEAGSRVSELERNHDDVRLELDRIASKQRQLERETEVLIERRDAERSRLYDGTVTNARELRSVEAEIEGTQRRISEHEDDLLDVLEQMEEVENRAADLEAAIQAGRDEVEQLTVARDAAAKGILAELADARVERERLAGELDPDLLGRYTAASQRPGGVGLGELRDGTCSACRIELSRADIGELLSGPPLATCPECRRLLVIPA